MPRAYGKTSDSVITLTITQLSQAWKDMIPEHILSWSVEKCSWKKKKKKRREKSHVSGSLIHATPYPHYRHSVPCHPAPGAPSDCPQPSSSFPSCFTFPSAAQDAAHHEICTEIQNTLCNASTESTQPFVQWLIRQHAAAGKKGEKKEWSVSAETYLHEAA